MPAGNNFHGRHQQLIVIVCQICFLKNRSQFKLIGSHFVMTGFHRNPQFQTFLFQIFHKSNHPSHKSCNSLTDCSKIMIIQLLVLSTFMSHQCTSGQHQIGTCRPKALIHQKIFLLPPQIGIHFFYFRIKITAYFNSRMIDCIQSPQQRCFKIQCLSCISNKNSRNTQGRVDDKSRRRRVPSAVSPGFKSIPDTSARKTRCIRFLLNQQFTCKFLQHTSFRIVFNKGIVLFSSSPCQGLKPMGIMSCSHIHSPLFHTCSDTICHFAAQRSPMLHCIQQTFIALFR